MESGKLTSSISTALVVIVVAGAVALGWLLFRPAEDQTFLSLVGRSRLEISPDRALPMLELTRPDGETLHTQDYGDGVILLNLWASWCSACKDELPRIAKLYQEMAPAGLRMLAVSVDSEVETGMEAAEDFRDDVPIAFDLNGRFSERVGSGQLPDTYLVKDGMILGRFPENADWGSDNLTSLLNYLLED